MPTDPAISDAVASKETSVSGGEPLSTATTEAPQPTVDLGPGLEGQVVASRYRIIELLGRGGMGAVYRADHVHIKKSFALKILHPELTHQKEAVKRFEREAIAAARIDHPNVATAIDFGNLPSGEFYLVLDYVQGQSLRSLLQQEQQLSEVRTIRISRQIAAALAAAHAANIVHRDLKPDNVMLVDSNAETDFVKVLDFGIAKLRSEEVSNEPAITRFGTIFGTPEYMSPEQALGHTVDARSDLYSLGIMMYEMLSGKTPFADEQLVTVLTRQMTDQPAPLTFATPELAAIIMQLLEKKPDLRQASAEKLTLQLDRLVIDRFGEPQTEAALSQRLLAIGTTDTLFVNTPNRREMLSNTNERALSLENGITPYFSLPPWIKRQIVVRGRRFPWVLIVLALSLIVVTIALTLTVGSLVRNDSPSPSATTDGSALASLEAKLSLSRELSRLVTQATQGDLEALKELEKRPESSRTTLEWTAIASGYAHNKNFIAATNAFRKAFSLDRKQPNTPQTRSYLFQAALDPDSSKLGLDTAVEYLETAGADLVYAVNEVILAGRAPKLDRKYIRQLLDSKALREHASPALQFALSLEDQKKSCLGYKTILSDGINNADARSLRALRKLSYERGCGLLGLGDCFSCLRGSRLLSETVEAAKSRPAPTF